MGNVSNFYLGRDETEKYSSDYVEVDGVKQTTDFGKYTLSINRARILGGYLFTFNDGMIASYKILDANIEAQSPKTVLNVYVERVFAHLTKTSPYFTKVDL